MTNEHEGLWFHVLGPDVEGEYVCTPLAEEQQRRQNADFTCRIDGRDYFGWPASFTEPCPCHGRPYGLISNDAEGVSAYWQRIDGYERRWREEGPR